MSCLNKDFEENVDFSIDILLIQLCDGYRAVSCVAVCKCSVSNICTLLKKGKEWKNIQKYLMQNSTTPQCPTNYHRGESTHIQRKS